MTQDRNEKRIAQLQADKDKLRQELNQVYDTLSTNLRMMLNLLDELQRLQELAMRYGASKEEAISREPIGK